MLAGECSFTFGCGSFVGIGLLIVVFCGECSFTFGGGSFLGIGLSIVAFVMDGCGVTTLLVVILLVTLGVGCVSNGGFAVSLKVTCLLSVESFG
jgi:hypothetical protein